MVDGKVDGTLFANTSIGTGPGPCGKTTLVRQSESQPSFPMLRVLVPEGTCILMGSTLWLVPGVALEGLLIP